MMNSETSSILTDVAKQAGAIVRCSKCGNYDVTADDEDANRQAYAMATNLWKDGVFRGESREDVMRMTKDVILNANWECPQCDVDRD